MSENKGTTRGKPSFMPMQGGGAVRDIEDVKIATAFRAAFHKQASCELLSDIGCCLRFRVVDVDNPPKRATARQIAAVESAANRLLEKLNNMPGSSCLLEEIAWRDPRRPMDTGNLRRWLVFLQSIESFGETKSPATAYRTTIRNIANTCAKNGVTVSQTENGAFLSFLEGLEEVWPGLIFPSGTVPQGRRDYLRESLRK